MNDYADSGNQQNYYAEALVSVLYPETVFVRKTAPALVRDHRDFRPAPAVQNRIRLFLIT